jgi:pyruvate dehydrogenase E2 component (dihydrolipoamide acetyltransferase)
MTVRDFLLPDLGEGLEDAEIVRWLVAEGDLVTVDQPLVEVVTAKANVELPSPFGGVIAALHYGAGDIVPVGGALVSIGELGEDVSGARLDGRAARSPAGSDSPAGSGNVLVGYGTRPERRRRRRAAAVTPEAESPEAESPGTASSGAESSSADSSEAGAPPVPPLRPAVLSPVVRRLAGELQVDLVSLRGSGPEGVITRGDVERAAGPLAPAGAVAPRRDGESTGAGVVERIPIRGARRQMGELLARSRREIPEATVWVDVDASGLLQAKRAIDDAHADRSHGVGIASWMARFCVLGLQRHPLLNSRIEGDEIVVSSRINLGFAAQTERGLVVPVVHGAEQLSLLELDDEIRRLATAARLGTIGAGELTGGTFTLNNYGVFGVDGSAAIINFPEVAIVGVGRILDRPWVVDGAVRPRPMTELTLSFDHRVCDGGEAGGFLRFVADCVEEPVRLLNL